MPDGLEPSLPLMNAYFSHQTRRCPETHILAKLEWTYNGNLAIPLPYLKSATIDVIGSFSNRLFVVQR